MLGVIRCILYTAWTIASLEAKKLTDSQSKRRAIAIATENARAHYGITCHFGIMQLLSVIGPRCPYMAIITAKCESCTTSFHRHTHSGGDRARGSSY